MEYAKIKCYPYCNFNHLCFEELYNCTLLNNYVNEIRPII